MIYETPALTGDLRARLGVLEDLRRQLGDNIAQPQWWMGSLRREVRASTVASSTSIEGFSVRPAEAAALVRGGAVPDNADENRQAVACYARAMDHVGAMAADPSFHWLERVILDLHFDACWFQRDKQPGLWRTDQVGVTAADGSLEFEGPEANEVPGLMREVVGWLENGDTESDPFVRAAMAHLHVTSVHPFRDGNGRVARIVQSLVLARAGMRSPEFFSIEDHLAAQTPTYYAALREVQAGRYQPQRDATSWVAFCVESHVEQARQRLEQIRLAAARWTYLEGLVDGRGWPERFVIALEQALARRTDRSSYGAEADIAPVTSSGDLRRMVDAGLLIQKDRGRNIGYEASEQLRTGLASAVKR